MYLPAEAVLTNLQFAAKNSAPGSSIVFDHLSSTAVDPALASEQRRRTLATLRDRGEPQIFGLPDGTEEAYLSGLGLRLVTHSFAISAETLRYLKRRDGTLLGGVQLPMLTVEAPRTVTQQLAADGVGWLTLAEMSQSRK